MLFRSALDTPAHLRAAALDPLFELRTTDSLHTVKLLQGVEGVLDVAMYGRAVHVAVSDADHAQRTIPEALKNNGIGLNTMRQIAPSLEDVFVYQVRTAGGAPVD